MCFGFQVDDIFSQLLLSNKIGNLLTTIHCPSTPPPRPPPVIMTRNAVTFDTNLRFSRKPDSNKRLLDNNRGLAMHSQRDHSGKSKSTIFRDLRRRAQCPLCSQLYNKPKSLECLHTFCEQCLKDEIDRQKRNEQEKFACPVCSRKYDDDVKSVEHLPIDFHSQSSLDIVKSFRNVEKEWEEEGTNSPVFCVQCSEEYGEKNEASHFCSDSRCLLCLEHVQRHKKMRKTKDHALQPVDQIERDKIIMLSKSDDYCLKHEEDKLRFVCSCGELICLHCAVMEHKPHQQVEIDAVAEEEKEKLRKLITQTEKDAASKEVFLIELLQMMDRIEKRCEDECTKIDNAANELKKLIDERVVEFPEFFTVIVQCFIFL